MTTSSPSPQAQTIIEKSRAFMIAVENATEMYEQLSQTIIDAGVDAGCEAAKEAELGKAYLTALCLFRLKRKVLTCPEEQIAVGMLLGFDKHFNDMAVLNTAMKAVSGCLIHGDKCPQDHKVDFPDHVDENLQPIAKEATDEKL